MWKQTLSTENIFIDYLHELFLSWARYLKKMENIPEALLFIISKVNKIEYDISKKPIKRVKQAGLSCAKLYSSW